MNIALIFNEERNGAGMFIHAHGWMNSHCTIWERDRFVVEPVC
jgi:hypothetical protein